MIYNKLSEFFSDLFKDKSREIIERTMEKFDIDDLDTASVLKRKRFAQHILKNHFNFSFQKNKYLYNKLISLLDIHHSYDVIDYKETVEQIKEKERQRIISSIEGKDEP